MMRPCKEVTVMQNTYLLYNTRDHNKVYKGNEWENINLPLSPFISGYFYPEHIIKGYTYFDNFSFRGETYLFDTIVKLSPKACRFLGAPTDYAQVVEHHITNDGLDRWVYVINIEGSVDRVTNNQRVVCTVSPERLATEIVFAAKPQNDEPIRPKLRKDSEVPEVYVGWIFYIAVMLISVFFRQKLGLWYFETIVFMFWRAIKLQPLPTCTTKLQSRLKQFAKLRYYGIDALKEDD